MTEVASARLDKALEEEDSESLLKPARTQSHFVELNSKNEDLLLEEIPSDAEKSLNKMLLDTENQEEQKVEDELLI